MTADITTPDTDQSSSPTEQAIAVIDTVEEGDRVLFNDRQQPLTVKSCRDLRRGRRGCQWVELEGPRGGVYKLTHRESKDGDPRVSLKRQTDRSGTIVETYYAIPLSSVEIVDQHSFQVGQIIEVTDPIQEAYYHVVSDVEPASCYDVETVGVWVRDGEVHQAETTGLFLESAKESLFSGGFEVLNTLTMGYGPGVENYYDHEQETAVYLSSPHDRGVDVRPVHGSGLEVLDWDTVLFGFEDRFSPISDAGGQAEAN